MSKQGFGDLLSEAIKRKRTPVMVGIDPRWDLLPEKIRKSYDEQANLYDVAEAYRDFSIRVLDAVCDLVPVVKFQAAFFEALGPQGMLALNDAMKHAVEQEVVVVLDGKRGDIGSTAEAYAEAYLRDKGPETRAWRSHAMTVHPFLGRETIEPFVKVGRESGTGLFVLTRTSNPGSGDLQMLQPEGKSISDRIAGWIEQWCGETVGESGYGIVGSVVGATHADEVASFRALMPHSILLLPGYGAQGAGAADTRAAFDHRGLGAVVNSSRGIIFAYRESQGSNWTDAVRSAAQSMIEDLRSHTPAGNLW